MSQCHCGSEFGLNGSQSTEVEMRDSQLDFECGSPSEQPWLPSGDVDMFDAEHSGVIAGEFGWTGPGYGLPEELHSSGKDCGFGAMSAYDDFAGMGPEDGNGTGASSPSGPGGLSSGSSEDGSAVDFDSFLNSSLPPLSRSSSTSASSRSSSPPTSVGEEPCSSPSCRRRSPRQAHPRPDIQTQPPTTRPQRNKAIPRTPPSTTERVSTTKKRMESCSCPVGGCQKSAPESFTRRDDLQRHMKTAHGLTSESFYCVHCDNVDKYHAYYRKDKVKSHWTNIHKKQGLEFQVRTEVRDIEIWAQRVYEAVPPHQMVAAR